MELVQMMDLAEASVIIMTSPLWTAALATLVEKGAWTRGDTASAALCLGRHDTYDQASAALQKYKDSWALL